MLSVPLMVLEMVGSTVDAMSDAIEGADVMVYGVSLRYKESANVRCCCDASCYPRSQSIGLIPLTSARVYVCNERSAEW